MDTRRGKYRIILYVLFSDIEIRRKDKTDHTEKSLQTQMILYVDEHGVTSISYANIQT